MKEVFVVQGPDGRVWNQTLAFDASQARSKFAHEFFGAWGVTLDPFTACGVWRAFQAHGFKMLCLTIQSDKTTTT